MSTTKPTGINCQACRHPHPQGGVCRAHRVHGPASTKGKPTPDGQGYEHTGRTITACPCGHPDNAAR